MQLFSWGVLVLTATLLATVTAAFAGKVRKPACAAVVARDCTPINGRFGYYGNPWCDTGSYRQEDIEFRARKQRQRGERAN
jgi:hypothetical protein